MLPPREVGHSKNLPAGLGYTQKESQPSETAASTKAGACGRPHSDRSWLLLGVRVQPKQQSAPQVLRRRRCRSAGRRRGQCRRPAPCVGRRCRVAPGAAACRPSRKSSEGWRKLTPARSVRANSAALLAAQRDPDRRQAPSRPRSRRRRRTRVHSKLNSALVAQRLDGRGRAASRDWREAGPVRSQPDISPRESGSGDPRTTPLLVHVATKSRCCGPTAGQPTDRQRRKARFATRRTGAGGVRETPGGT